LIQPKTQTTPAPGAAPVLAAGARSAPSATAVYEGFRAQRRELTNQLNDLQGTRETISGQLEEMSATASERKPLETRLTDVDQRISTVDGMLAANATQLAQAAAIPGAVVELPPPIQQGFSEDTYAFGFVLLLVMILPLSVAFARRVWRRSPATAASFPREIADRLSRMEQAVEATSLEVERIGEGQRFLTRLFTEGEAARALGAGAAQFAERKAAAKLPERLP
jgi:hypothetical protein